MKRIFSALFLFALCLSLHAVPARREPFELTLPDGSQLTIRLHGDEHYHFRTTLDGFLINDKNDYFYYVKQRRNGKQVLSHRKAHNEQERSKREVRWLARHGVNKFNQNK